MADEIFTADDIAQANNGYEILGPAYFAARRVSESIMQGVESDPLKKVLAKCADELTQGVYQYIEDGIRADLESNFQNHIRHMVERTVRALLTGEPWALKQYPLSQYHDGDLIRAAIAKHCAPQILTMRVAELENEVERLRESLKYSR